MPFLSLTVLTITSTTVSRSFDESDYCRRMLFVVTDHSFWAGSRWYESEAGVCISQCRRPACQEILSAPSPKPRPRWPHLMNSPREWPTADSYSLRRTINSNDRAFGSFHFQPCLVWWVGCLAGWLHGPFFYFLPVLHLVLQGEVRMPQAATHRLSCPNPVLFSWQRFWCFNWLTQFSRTNMLIPCLLRTQHKTETRRSLLASRSLAKLNLSKQCDTTFLLKKSMA